MADVILVTYELTDDGADRLRAFFEDVDPDAEATREVLRAEGMYTESLFVEETPDGDYLRWYMEAEDVDQVLAVYDALEEPLVEAFDDLAAEVLVGGMEGVVRTTAPVVHAVNPDRPGDAG